MRFFQAMPCHQIRSPTGKRSRTAWQWPEFLGIQLPDSCARLGFTLLEVIISIALTSTLMVLLWSLFFTFTKLEERSRQSAMEIQLVRSLSRQLRSDLDHFAAIAMAPNVVPQARAKPVATGEDTTKSEVMDQTDKDSVPTPVSDAAQTIGGDAVGPLDSTTVFATRLPDQTYLRGSATRLELVTRLPYTVDVPTGQQRLGAETRYGTFQLVVYEFRGARDLKSLLSSDPVLNPSLFVPPPTPLPAAPNQPPPPAPPPVAQPLNPNESVGLRRETKSWLQVERDRRQETLFKQAEAAGLLVDGQLPPAEQPLAEQPRDLLSELQDKTNTARQTTSPMNATTPAVWTPPPEFKTKIDDLPEVTRLQFRYFDGTSWQLDWPGEEGRLPRAIEVAFDLDPDAPAVRAKEFAEAHASVLNGATIDEVLPTEELEVTEFEDEQDPLTLLNLADPTAIVSEYRFVIALPHAGTEPSESTETPGVDGEEVLK